MNQSKYAFQAGLFILLSIAAAIILIAWVAESRNAPTDAKHYTAVFADGEDIAGLSPGAEVRLMGVKVGRIDEVKVVTPTEPNQGAEIHVDFSVGQGVALRSIDPELELQTAVTGGAWLNILRVGTGPTLADGEKVRAETSNLLAIMTDVRDELEETLSVVRKDLDKVSDELVETADGIESFTKSADRMITSIETSASSLLKETSGVMGDIRSVFGDSGDDIRTTLAKLSSLTTRLDKQLPETLDEVAGFIKKTETSIEGVDKLVTEITGTATEARTLLADNRTDIDRTIQSARRSVDELEGLVDDLRANPSRLIWPPDEKDLNNNTLYAMARSYAKAAEDLESAAGALHTASQEEGVDQEKIEVLRTKLMEQFKHFDKLQGEVWERFEK